MPEEFGGGGTTDFRYATVLAEEFTRAGTPGLALGLHNDVIGPYLTTLATEEQKRRWLPGFCDGSLVTAIAMTEPGSQAPTSRASAPTPRTGATTGC